MYFAQSKFKSTSNLLSLKDLLNQFNNVQQYKFGHPE